MPRPRFRRPLLDSAVAALETRTAPLLAPETADPTDRHRVARENDTKVRAALDICPIATTSEDHVVTVAGHRDVRVRVYWPDEERTPAGTEVPALVYFYDDGFTIAGID